MSAIKRGRNGDVLVVRTPATTLRHLTGCCANRRLNGALSLIAFGIALVDLVFTSLRHDLRDLPITVTLIFVFELRANETDCCQCRSSKSVGGTSGDMILLRRVSNDW